MRYDKRQVAAKLLRWEAFVQNYRLPGWEELPVIGLYMDQVIALLNNYLGFFAFDGSGEKLITASMVNNYVKMKLLPAPVKKRYEKKHIACLIMICTFKQSASMAVVKRMLPPDDETAIRRVYANFVAVHKRLSLYFVEQVRANAAPVFDEESHTGDEVSNLLVGSAVAASFARLLTGKIAMLQLPEAEPEDSSGKKKALK